MRDELRKAIAATKGLTTDELQELRKHLTGLISMGPSSVDRKEAPMPGSGAYHWVLYEIVDYLKSQGMDQVYVSSLTSGAHYDTFRKKLPAIESFLKKAGPKVKQRALCKLGLVLLHEDLRKIGIAVSAQIVMSHMHRLPGVIDRSFPGYAAEGNLFKIFKGETNVRQKRDHDSIPKRRRKAFGP